MITNHTLLIKIIHVLLKSLIALFKDFPGNASGMCVFDLRQHCKLDICTRSIFCQYMQKYEKYIWNVFIQCTHLRLKKLSLLGRENKLFFICLFFQLLINILNIIQIFVTYMNFITWKIDCFWWCKQKVKFRSFLCHVVYIRSYLKLIAKIYQWKDPPLKKSKTNILSTLCRIILFAYFKSFIKYKSQILFISVKDILK